MHLREIRFQAGHTLILKLKMFHNFLFIYYILKTQDFKRYDHKSKSVMFAVRNHFLDCSSNIDFGIFHPARV